MTKNQTSSCSQYLGTKSLFSLAGDESDSISVCEAELIHSRNERVDLTETGINIYSKLGQEISNFSELSLLKRYSIAYFIHFGTQTTEILGQGERAGVVSSFFKAFKRVPDTIEDWSDIVKIANGRWPTQTNKEAENTAKTKFKEIYLRDAEMSQPNDNAAVTIIAYGLRPANRNLESENSAINIFKGIFKFSPATALAWDMVRAIAYSGAVR